jgi:nucleoside-diphosphate-sugar epimerase
MAGGIAPALPMKLFIIGLGYTSLAFARRYRHDFSHIVGTVRSASKAARLACEPPLGEAIAARLFHGAEVDPRIAGELAQAEALLVSAPPDEEGDPTLRDFAGIIAAAPRLRWVGYLSTVGVYGDHGGAWVDEWSPLRPVTARSIRRVAAERAWLALAGRSRAAVHVLRLAGIYGPRRNALVNVAEGTARRIVKPGQVFNRIHVDDIATIVAASLASGVASGVFNVSDDEPAPPQDVVAYAAGLLGLPAPVAMAFDEAPLSPMGRSFYGENKRVSNGRVRAELGVRLAYPTYREGLAALAAAGEGKPC